MTAVQRRAWPLWAAALLALATGCSDERSNSGSNPPASESRPPAATTPPPAAAPAPAAAPSSAAPQAAAPAAPTGALDGKTLFLTYCATCHGPNGKGDGPGAAALEPKPRDFTSGVFKFDPNGDGKTGEPADLVEVVKNGAAKYGGSPNMVPWGNVLNEQQIQALVQYVKSFSRS